MMVQPFGTSIGPNNRRESPGAAQAAGDAAQTHATLPEFPLILQRPDTSLVTVFHVETEAFAANGYRRGGVRGLKLRLLWRICHNPQQSLGCGSRTGSNGSFLRHSAAWRSQGTRVRLCVLGGVL
jgi:hypothetical protein